MLALRPVTAFTVVKMIINTDECVIAKLDTVTENLLVWVWPQIEVGPFPASLSYELHARKHKGLSPALCRSFPFTHLDGERQCGDDYLLVKLFQRKIKVSLGRQRYLGIDVVPALILFSEAAVWQGSSYLLWLRLLNFTAHLGWISTCVRAYGREFNWLYVRK